VIFERLNTGGVNLQPQEIRVALYHGEFVRVLRQLNENSAWRALFGAKSKRLKDMELILRFFAFYYYANQYRSPMKDFLNRYMASNRSLQRQGEPELVELFEKTVAVIHEGIGQRAFRPIRSVNAAVVDSLMTGIAKRVSQREVKNTEQLKQHYDRLIKSENYLAAVETGTSQEANVDTRLRLAQEAFRGVR